MFRAILGRSADRNRPGEIPGRSRDCSAMSPVRSQDGPGTVRDRLGVPGTIQGSSQVDPETVQGRAEGRTETVPKLPPAGPVPSRHDSGPSRDRPSTVWEIPGAFQGLFRGVPGTARGHSRHLPGIVLAVQEMVWDYCGTVQGQPRARPMIASELSLDCPGSVPGRSRAGFETAPEQLRNRPRIAPGSSRDFDGAVAAPSRNCTGTVPGSSRDCD